jgi:hypothetical protein
VSIIEINFQLKNSQSISMIEKTNTPRFDLGELNVREFRKMLQSISNRVEFEAALLRQVDFNSSMIGK